MTRTLRVVFLKEARELLRDRRALFFLLAPPLLVPLFAVAAVLLLGWRITQQAPEGFPLAIEGAAHAPALVDRLEQESLLQIRERPASPTQALQSGELMALLTIPADTPQRLQAEQPVSITLTTSRVGWMPALVDMAIQEAMDDYGQTVLRTRLAEHGLDPDWVRPLHLVKTSAPTTGITAPPARIAEGEARSFNGLIIPFMVASWTMGGGLQLIAYMTVGEKDRGTMEPLLVTAASRVGIALGKVALSMLASLITVALWAIDGLGYLFIVNLSPMLPAISPAPLAMQARAFGLAGIWLFLLMLPLMTMVSGVTTAACTFARNFREANLFLTLMQLGLPGLSFAAVLIVPAIPSAVVYALPFVGVLVAVRDLFLQGLAPASLALAVVASVAYALLSILLAAYVFSREWALMRGL